VLARVRALGVVIRHPRPIGITVDGEPLNARVVLVANNAYALDPLSLGARPRLDEGLLRLYVPAGLFLESWRDRGATRFVVDAGASCLRAAADGESRLFETPIVFTIEPAALPVLQPGNPAS
jgi:hypothetical protein